MPEVSQLRVGHEFTPVRYQLRPEEVELYLRAVGDSTPLFRQQGLTPPTALAAYALRGILQEINLPPGAVHAAQELSFLGTVVQGEAVVFRAKLTQSALRGSWRFLAFDFSGVDSSGKRVMEGRSTVLIPVGEGGEGAIEAR